MILARNSNTTTYSISFHTYSVTLADTNTLDNITACGFSTIHPTGDVVIRLDAAKEGYDLVYTRH
ncbi:MAG: hypothetical protein AB8W78_12910 [Arsenophonus endosymbiont of Dermacentor nuttalli]